MNKIKKVLLFAMSFVMATGLFTGCFMMPTTNSSSNESTVSESSSESSLQSSTQSSTESSSEAPVESSEESSKESSSEAPVQSSEEASTESSSEAPVESSEEASTESSVEDSSVEETQKYSLTFVIGNPRLDPNAVVTTEVEAGATVELPEDPTADGKTFAGWVDLEGNPVTEDFTMPEEDVAIYATWNVTAYTLTIKQEGKEDVVLNFGVEAVPATEETAEIIDINALDFILSGMYVGSTEIAYEFEGKPEAWVLEDTTITVVETVAKYTVTFVVGNPRLDPNAAISTEIAYGATVELPADPVAEGKTFAGWVDLEGNPVTESFVVEGDVAIYATWNVTAYTLTITQEGAEDVVLYFGVEAVPATEETAEIIDINALDFVLEGLLPEATDTTVYVFENKPEEWTLADTTLNIVEEARKYWLIIQDGNAWAGGYYEELEVAYGSEIELPDRGDVEGKIFLGWYYSDLETDEEFEAPATMPAMDIRIYAKWELITKTLTVTRADGEVIDYLIAVEEGGDWFNPIIGLDNLDFFLENQLTIPASEYYNVYYVGIPETWELKDYAISEVVESTITYLDRLNKTWEQKPGNANNYWDGAENVVTVEHLAGGVTMVGFDATKFTADQLAAGDAGWAGWSNDRQMWVTFAVPVNGINLNKFTATFDVKFENMSPKFNVLAAKNYTGTAGYDFEMGAERTGYASTAEDLGDGWYRFTIEIAPDDVVGMAADYFVISFDNTDASVDKSLPSYAYIANFALNCKHEYVADCGTICELCGESRWDAAEHAGLSGEYISDGWYGHYQVCSVCGENSEGWCETTYVYDEFGHYEVCELCGFETEAEDHWMEAGYNEDGHYENGCYCGYITSEVIPHTLVEYYDSWGHWYECECWYSTEYLEHALSYEVSNTGHTALGCDECEYGAEEPVEEPHNFSEWVVDEKYEWIYTRECYDCGHKQTIKDRLDSPQQYVLVENPTLDITGIFVEGVDPSTVRVIEAASTYSYWDFAAGQDGGKVTIDFLSDNFDVIINEDGSVTYAFDAAKVQAAPYYYGYKTLTLTVEFEDGSTKEINAVIYAVTKVIKTAADLKALGVGGKAGSGIMQNSDVAGNDVIGYFLLGNDINCEGMVFAAGYSYGKSFFKHSTFDGNGHTISNLTVGAGGLFGGFYASTVKNVNFTGVTLGIGNGNEDGFWGNYAALFAHYTTGSSTQRAKFIDINVEFTNINVRRDNYQFDDGLLVAGSKTYATFQNVVVDASGLDVECALGYQIDNSTDIIYDNVVYYAKSVKVIGYNGNGGSNASGAWVELDKLSAWPTGTSFYTTTSTKVEDEFIANCDGTVTLKSDAFVEGEIYYIGEDFFICGVAGELEVALNVPVGNTYTVRVIHQADGVENRIVFTNVVLEHTASEPVCGEYTFCIICGTEYGENGHKGAWVQEGDMKVYTCQCGEESASIVTRLTERQRFNLDAQVNGGVVAATKGISLDLSGVGDYVSATISFGAGAYDPTNIEAGAIPLSVYGEQDLVVTVVTADGTEHKVTVPVLIVTAIFDTAAELNTFYTIANATHSAVYQQGGYFELGANIAYNAVWSGWTNWGGLGYKTPEVTASNDTIAGFQGVFDGCGYAIDGLEINNGYWAGFIAVIGENGIVRNVGFTNAKNSGGGSGYISTIGNGLIENVYVKYAAGSKTNAAQGYSSTFMATDNPKGMTTYMTIRDCFVDASEITEVSGWSYLVTNAHKENALLVKFEGVYVKHAHYMALAYNLVTAVEGSTFDYFSASNEAQKAEYASWNTDFWSINADGVPVWNSSL